MIRIWSARITVLVIILPLLMGMGGLKEQKSPGEIPIPNLNFGAVITDVSGAMAELTHVSINGRTFFIGQHGKATITIDFDKIDEVVFTATGQKLMATVTILGGGKKIIYLDTASMFTGRTEYGTYQIEAKDIRVLKLKGIQKQ